MPRARLVLSLIFFALISLALPGLANAQTPVGAPIQAAAVSSGLC